MQTQSVRLVIVELFLSDNTFYIIMYEEQKQLKRIQEKINTLKRKKNCLILFTLP